MDARGEGVHVVVVKGFSDSFFRDVAENLKFRYLGLGCLWAWIYATWMTPVVFPGSGGLTVQNDLSWLLSAGAVAVSLMVMPFLLRDRDISSIGWIRILAGLGTTAGSIMMALQPIFGVSQPMASNIGAVLTGITSCWLWMLWGEFTGFVEQEVSETFVPACVLVPLVVIFTCSFITGPVASIAICLLPTVSSALLELSLHDAEVIKPVPLLTAEDCPPFWGDFLRVGLGSLAIYTCISFGWGMTDFQEVTGWGSATALAYVIGAALAILVASLSIAYSRRLDLFGLYRWLVPVMLASLTLMTIGNFWTSFISFVLLIMAQFCFDIIVWIYFSRMVRKGVCRGSLAIGINRGFVQVGVVTGSLVAMSTPALIASGLVSEQLVVLVLATIMVAVVLSVLNQRERLEKTINTGATASNASIGDQVDQVCDRMAQEAALTGREREILGYLARGRSLPYIREELVLSKNTVETHAKNLYRKLGIHSRQELIDLIQSEA